MKIVYTFSLDSSYTTCCIFSVQIAWQLTILSKKFLNQCMEQNNSKVPSKHSPIIQGFILDMAGKKYLCKK